MCCVLQGCIDNLRATLTLSLCVLQGCIDNLRATLTLSLCLCCVLQGCIDKLSEFLQEHLIIVGAVGIGLSCLQVRSQPHFYETLSNQTQCNLSRVVPAVQENSYGMCDIAQYICVTLL